MTSDSKLSDFEALIDSFSSTIIIRDTEMFDSELIDNMIRSTLSSIDITDSQVHDIESSRELEVISGSSETSMNLDNF